MDTTARRKSRRSFLVEPLVTELENSDSQPETSSSAYEEMKIAKYNQEVLEWRTLYNDLKKRKADMKKEMLKYDKIPAGSDDPSYLNLMTEEDREYLLGARQLVQENSEAKKNVETMLDDVKVMYIKSVFYNKLAKKSLNDLQKKLTHIENVICQQTVEKEQIPVDDLSIADE